MRLLATFLLCINCAFCDGQTAKEFYDVGCKYYSGGHWGNASVNLRRAAKLLHGREPFAYDCFRKCIYAEYYSDGSNSPNGYLTYKKMRQELNMPVDTTLTIMALVDYTHFIRKFVADSVFVFNCADELIQKDAVWYRLKSIIYNEFAQLDTKEWVSDGHSKYYEQKRDYCNKLIKGDYEKRLPPKIKKPR